MKILIVGDSFSDPSWASNTYDSWPELLEKNYSITNLSVCGSSAWWAYQQFLKNKDQHDYTIFVVTVPNRVYLEDDNIHLNINTSTPFNGTTLENIYYRFFYSKTREDFFHNSVVEDVKKNSNVLLIPAFNESIPDYNSLSLCSFADMEADFYKKERPIITDNKRKCHLSKESNYTVYEKIIKAINDRDKILYLTENDFVNPSDTKSYYWN